MSQSIPALLPCKEGIQFVVYGDSCSGVRGTANTLAHERVASVIARFDPAPEMVIFPGDEIVGLTDDADALRAQWRHWFDVEMAWLDRARIPLWHTTGNHTAWDEESEIIFAEVMAHLPRNGPAGQEGLSYFVRRGPLLLIFVHTLWSGLGGEGYVETDWLEATLTANADARWKVIIGHHPAWAVNGFEGPVGRTLAEPDKFWDVLVRHGVFAYLCSHILAFDVQVRAGVLQITTAGAGTVHRMPPEIEYLHAVQMALDAEGLHAQVIDDAGTVRERFDWPPKADIVSVGEVGAEGAVFHLRAPVAASARRRTLLEMYEGDSLRLWCGQAGPQRRLTVTLHPEVGRSPHYWLGPEINGDVDLDLAVMPSMGPGGILWRRPEGPWSSLTSGSAWGAERLRWPLRAELAL